MAKLTYFYNHQMLDQIFQKLEPQNSDISIACRNAYLHKALKLRHLRSGDCEFPGIQSPSEIPSGQVTISAVPFICI